MFGQFGRVEIDNTYLYADLEKIGNNGQFKNPMGISSRTRKYRRYIGPDQFDRIIHKVGATL